MIRKKMEKVESVNEVSVDEAFAVEDAAPEPVAAAPEVRPSRKPPEAEFTCTARQWTRIKRIHFTNAEGFLSEMKRKFPNALKTRPQWEAEWNTFLNRPVR